jgi:uncharacterized membrane protein (DUF106 family)
MGLALKQIKTYAKLVLMIAVALLILLVIVMNRNHKVEVWLIYRFPQTNVLWVMLVSGLSTVVIVKASGWVRKVLRDMKQLRKARDAETKVAEQRELAAKLKEQESRIDSKIEEMISQPGQASDSE